MPTIRTRKAATTHEVDNPHSNRVKPKVAKPEPNSNGHTYASGQASWTKDHIEPREKKDKYLDSLCENLVGLQRQRTIVVKSRIMQQIRLQAVVAGTDLNYSNSLKEKERKDLYRQAQQLIDDVVKGKATSKITNVIKATSIGISALNDEQERLEEAMEGIAVQLPVVKWLHSKEQAGFKEGFLAQVIGETGNLDNYTNPGKLWKRLSCAPREFNGYTHMGECWRRGWAEVSLPAEEWVKYGYSKRRRSLSYLIGKNLVMQNKSIYRQHYLDKKEEAKGKHPDWTDMHCHKHGMLLATKLLLKRLWIEWRK